MAARPDIRRAVARPMRTSALARPAGRAWPRRPAWSELATLGAGYAAYACQRPQMTALFMDAKDMLRSLRGS